MRIFAALFLLLSASCASLEAPVAAPAIAVTAKPVPLDPATPDRTILGRLRYLGGLELTSPDKSFGGFSSLKWRNGRLYTITDAGDWMVLQPLERSGRLEGLWVLAAGDLLGPDGAKLEGSATGDAEALAPDGKGWLVGFEHDHKILRYPRLGARAEASGLDPRQIFAGLEDNQGVEALATRRDRTFLCAERLPGEAPNCFIRGGSRDVPVRIPPPPGGLDPKTAFPVDADWAADGTLYILMRSWSGGSDNRVALMSRSPRGELRTLATFLRPVTLDNYEGLALREEYGRTFLYMISDDNFRAYDQLDKPETWQRTLLLKFELLG